MNAKELIEQIKNGDDKVRGAAWQAAGNAGSTAVRGLAELMFTGEQEVARAAKRALWKIVRYAGRPAGGDETKAVAKELVPLLASGDPNVRREFVWMLSEIGDIHAAPMIALLLNNPNLREDARAALQRIPGDTSLRSLKVALKNGAEDHKPAIAESLRVRGEKVKDFPNQKLVPRKQTAVKNPLAV